jgi:hypothetical protein
MIHFIQNCTSLGADDGYALCIAADLIITQIVDGNKGVHVTSPALFRNERAEDA